MNAQGCCRDRPAIVIQRGATNNIIRLQEFSSTRYTNEQTVAGITVMSLFSC